MALKFSRTSCVFKQVPVGPLRVVSGKREMQAANDNVFVSSPSVAAHDSPSLADVGPIFALMAISGGTFYLISSVLIGYLKSFPIIYP